MTPNRARGEVSIFIDGVERRLCLTLGALAEIEAALEAQSLTDLAQRLRRLSAKDLNAVLAALLRGGGEDALARDLQSHAVDLLAAADAVARCFASLA